jgi:hypothetical protein
LKWLVSTTHLKQRSAANARSEQRRIAREFRGSQSKMLMQAIKGIYLGTSFAQEAR